MVATLSINTAGTSWSVGDERSYDVWGSVRGGSATGGPKGRYVANLGHVQDDESGLIYMRARYYEPESGRFVSEDKMLENANWFLYGRNDPVNKKDFSGNGEITGSGDYMGMMMSLGTVALFGALLLGTNFMVPSTPNEKLVAIGLVAVAAFFMSEALGQTSYSQERAVSWFNAASAFVGFFALILAGWSGNAKFNKLGGVLGQVLVGIGVAYSITVLGLIIAIDAGE
ncbi:MAG: RHS repeat-associated core domain-containing protein [Fimbriimonadaceae bacterium]